MSQVLPVKLAHYFVEVVRGRFVRLIQQFFKLGLQLSSFLLKVGLPKFVGALVARGLVWLNRCIIDYQVRHITGGVSVIIFVAIDHLVQIDLVVLT